MATFNGKVTGGRLNLRANASTDSNSLALIPNDTQIVVSQYSMNNNWYCTTYGGDNGFVMAQYVTILSSVPTRSCNVTGGGLNLRVSPSTASISPIQIPNNTALTVQTHNSTWSTTTYGGYSGFVMSQFLTGGSTASMLYGRVTVSSDKLNVCESPGGDVLGLFPNNRIIICEDIGSNSWYRTRYQGDDAYVSKSYITLISSPAIHNTYIERCNYIYPPEVGRTDASDFDDASGQWCQYFVNWLLRSSYMPSSRVPTTGGTGWGITFWVNNAQFYFKSATHKARINNETTYNYDLNVGDTLTTEEQNYEPSAGDIIYLRWSHETNPSVNVNHTGYVYDVDGNTVYTVEGNAGNNGAVMMRTYSLTDPQIVGYGKPDYS